MSTSDLHSYSGIRDKKFTFLAGLICLSTICALLCSCGPIMRRAALNHRLEEQQQQAKEAYNKVLKQSQEERHCVLGIAINPRTFVVRALARTAQDAGLLEGDKILAVNNIQISTKNDFKQIFKSIEHTRSVPLTVLRGNQQLLLECACLDQNELYSNALEALKEASNGNWHDGYSNWGRLERMKPATSEFKNVQVLLYLNYLLSKGKNPDTDSTLPYLIYEATLLKVEEESYSTEALKNARPEIRKKCDLLKKANHPELSEEIENEYEHALHLASLPPEPAPQKADQPPPKQERIQPNFATGTGFTVSPDGRVMTAFHVVEGASTIKLHFTDGTTERAIIEQSLPPADIAILKTNRTTSDFLSLAPMRSAKVGQRVFTVGFPVPQVLGQEPKYTDGSISSLTGLENSAAFMQITVPLQPGNSGGPLVNEHGEVLGIVTSTAGIKSFLERTGTLPQNVNWAVKADYAYPLFDQVQSEGGQTFTHDEVVEKVQHAVCLIEAQR